MADIIDTTEVASTEALLVPAASEIAPERGLDKPQNYGEQMDRWSGLIASRALPQHVKTPQQALAIAAMGAEFGWAPMKSLRSIYLVNGNPQMSAQAMLGLVYERMPEARVEILQNDNEAAKVRSCRGPNEPWAEFSFTYEDAKRAKLPSTPGNTWQHSTADMLWARCVSRMCRRMFPDVVQGCYVAGELETVVEAEPKPKRGEVNESANRLLLGQAPEEGGDDEPEA